MRFATSPSGDGIPDHPVGDRFLLALGLRVKILALPLTEQNAIPLHQSIYRADEEDLRVLGRYHPHRLPDGGLQHFLVVAATFRRKEFICEMAFSIWLKSGL